MTSRVSHALFPSLQTYFTIFTHTIQFVNRFLHSPFHKFEITVSFIIIIIFQ